MAGEDVVTDLDREVSDDAAPPPDEAPVADGDDRVAHRHLTHRHPDGEADVGPDAGPAADADVALVVDGGRRKRDEAVLTEGAEATGGCLPRSDGTGDGGACPRPLQRAGEGAAGGDGGR